MKSDTPPTIDDANKMPRALQWLRREWPILSLNALLVGMLVAFGAVMFHAPAVDYFESLLGLHKKNEVLSFLGIGMGGLLVALQAAMSYKRAKAMERAANAQADAAIAQARANIYTEDGQRQERLKNAIEHLGNDSVSVRLGAAYELFALARDTEGLRQRVLELLCAHIREVTRSPDYRREYRSTPSVEVQSLLTLLLRKRQDEYVFQGHNVELQRTWLNGSDLSDAHLPAANFEGAFLQGAEFAGAKLMSAFFHDANLRGASLPYAELQTAILTKAQLQGANLCGAGLHAADLSDAELQGALLLKAQLQGGHFERTALHGVYCTGEWDYSTSIREKAATQGWA